jgi:hypothetical protein
MIKYAKKRPVVCPVIHFDGTKESAEEIRDWLVGSPTPATYAPVFKVEGDALIVVHNLYIETLEGLLEVLPGSYVLQGVKGEHWAVRGDIFAETYDWVTP